MSAHDIVIGVDTSPEGTEAAAFAFRLGEVLRARCHLVHAVPEPWIAVPDVPVPPDLEAIRRALAERAREETLLATRGSDIPEHADVIVRFGRPVRVLRDAVAELDAGFVVLGGKRHPALERWLGGSTAHNAVRALPVPVIVTRHPPPAVRRVLAAADLSAAAGPTLAAAERMADAWGAELRVVSALEPLPPGASGAGMDSPEYRALWEEMLRRDVWPLIRGRGVKAMVRHGPVVDVLRREALEWPADLLVMGSHGKGWIDRLLLGSVTERVLNELPTSLLVVPTAVALTPAAVESREVFATGYIP
jgi:nucleotide-binding universal stress UspA family protein